MRFYNPIKSLYNLFKSCMKSDDYNENGYSNDWHYTHKKGDTQFFNIVTKQIYDVNITTR